MAYAASGVVIACVLVASPVGADLYIDGSDKGLSFEEELALVEAKDRGDIVALRSIVIAAIVTKPAESTAIVKDVYRLAPALAGDVIQTAADSLPNLSEKLMEAAESVVTPAEMAAPADVRAKSTEERLDTDPDENPYGAWSGETVLGGTYRNALDKTVTANAEFNVEQKIGRWTNTAGLTFDYGRTNGETYTHIFELDGKSKRDLDEDYYGYGLLKYKDDRFDGFDYRLTEGIGIGYTILNDEDVEWSVEGGPSLRQSRIDETDQWGNELLGRLASIFDWDISDTANLSNETSFLFTKDSIEVNSEAYSRLRDKSETTNTTALDLQVIGNLGARLSYEIHYVSEPPEGAQKNESVAKFALVHSF